MEGGRNEAAEKKLTLSGLRRRYSSTEPCYEKCVVEVVADSCGCKLEKADPTQGGKESELPNCNDDDGDQECAEEVRPPQPVS